MMKSSMETDKDVWMRLLYAARACRMVGNEAGATLLYRKGLEVAALTSSQPNSDLIQFLCKNFWDTDTWRSCRELTLPDMAPRISTRIISEAMERNMIEHAVTL